MAAEQGDAEGRGEAAERARALALRVLAFHARTEAQLASRLTRAGFGAEVAGVLAWLRRLGYRDDAAYARGRARQLLRGGRLGLARVALKLRMEGIADVAASEAVRSALGEVAGEGGEEALCRAALAKKLRGTRADALDTRQRARAAGFLLGRGFSAAAVSRALGGWEAGSEGSGEDSS